MITLEYIQEFLLSKGFVWKQYIRDCLKMIYRPATDEDFKGTKMVRLVVSKPNKDQQFIQRVIVSNCKFKIENLKLNKMDNFEDFSEEWINFFESKIKKVNTNQETIVTNQ